MKRIALIATALLLALGIFALPALAHGGTFRGPGDGVPPGLREPSDPTPPPPPPPSGPPPTTPTPTTPSPIGPTQPSTPTQAPPTATGPNTNQPTRGRTTAPSFEDWTFWYQNNKDDIENLKKRLYEIYSSDVAIFQSGDEDTGSRTAATRMTQQEVQRVVIPALLWAMDPKNSKHQDTESAAYIALAKVARDPEHIKTIMGGLDKAKKTDLIVQESTALALGLLRRQDRNNQFTPRDLDAVRDFLFTIVQDDDYQARTRGFAAVAIGMLGDQPTGSGDYANDEQAAARRTTQRLFELLREKYSNQDIYIAILMAIGLQPQTSITDEDREVLAEAGFKGRLYKDSINEMIQSYAAHTLGRIGTANDRKTLANILTARRGVSNNVKRSAAIGLGLLSRLVSGPDRVEVAKILEQAIAKVKDNSTRNFAIISLAYLLIDDIKSETTDVMGNTRAEETLIELARKGNYMERPFGALALGLVVREIEDDLDIEAYQKFKEEALKAIRFGLTDAKDKKVAAAFCTAAGIAKDSGSRKQLVKFVNDKRGDKMLRGYAALSLGLVGDKNPEIIKAIAEALLERSSEDLRRQSAVALGLLGNQKVPGTGKTAVQILLEELKKAKSQNHKGQVVLALASIGDHTAVQPLVDLLKNKSEQDLTRALACAGLGLMGDLEWLPSLARVSKNVNYRASTNLVNELLSIL